MKARWKAAVLASCIIAGILVPAVLVMQNTPLRVVRLPTNVFSTWSEIDDNEVIRLDIGSIVDQGKMFELPVYSVSTRSNISVYFNLIFNEAALENIIGQDLYTGDGTPKIFWFNAAHVTDGFFIVFQLRGCWCTNYLAFRESRYGTITFDDVINAVLTNDE
nr:hypothetical protein [Candidatus Sigynarchaeota archaeon]